MKKRIIAIVLAMVMVCTSAAVAFAAENQVSADEQAVLDEFCTMVDERLGSIDSEIATQYKTEAEMALTKVDLDKTACEELSAAVKAVGKILDDNNATDKKTAAACLPEVLKTVNAVANKYGMDVSVNTLSEKGLATVTINGEPAVEPVKPNQTGFDTTATIVVAALVVVALGAGFVVVTKKNLLVK